MKTKSTFCLIFIFLFLGGIPSWLQAQNKMDEIFNRFKGKSDQIIGQTKENMNLSFARYLSQTWEMFSVEQPEKGRYTPKEDTAQILMQQEEIQEKQTRMFYAPVDKTSSGILFLGNFFPLPHIESIDFELLNIEEPSIGAAWRALTLKHLDSLIIEAIQIKNRYKLNDWGYYQLICQIVNQQIQGKKQENRKRVLTAYYLVQSGFNIKMARAGDQLILLIPFASKLFGKTFVYINNQRFYIVEEKFNSKNESIFSYKNSLTPTDKPIHLIMGDMLEFKEVQMHTRSLFFPDNQERGEIRIPLQKVDLCKSVPQTELPIYALSQRDPSLQHSLIDPLKKRVEGKSEKESLDFLMRFFQSNFPYKEDPKQFGYEKVMFVEELLYYPYSDCEDRSIFFSWLAKEVLGKECLLINYSDHVSCAVQIGSVDPSDDYFKYEGQAYIVCDPSYLNAPIGQCMPEYKKQKAEIISLKYSF